MNDKLFKEVIASFHTSVNGIEKRNIQTYIEQAEGFARLLGASPVAFNIMNYNTLKYEYVSPGFANFFGKRFLETMKTGGPKASFGYLHPEDLLIIGQQVLPTSFQSLNEFTPYQKLRCNCTYNCRGRKVDGSFGDFVQTSVILELNEVGAPIIDFSILTEIKSSKIPKNIELNISLLNDNNEYETILEQTFQRKQPDHNLTKRELEIIRFVANGMSSKQIAGALFISQHTVNTHRRNILVKLKTNSMSEVVNYALTNNLI